MVGLFHSQLKLSGTEFCIEPNHGIGEKVVANSDIILSECTTIKNVCGVTYWIFFCTPGFIFYALWSHNSDDFLWRNDLSLINIINALVSMDHNQKCADDVIGTVQPIRYMFLHFSLLKG